MAAVVEHIGHIAGIHFAPGKTVVCIHTEHGSFTCSASPRLVQQALKLREGLVRVRIASLPEPELIHIRQEMPRTVPTTAISRQTSDIVTVDLSS